MKNKVSLFILLLLLLFSLATGCSKDSQPLTKLEFLMGTFCKITIYDKNADISLLDESFAVIKDIEERMTVTGDPLKSEIIALNSKAGMDFVPLSSDTSHLIKQSHYYWLLSQGKYDITIGPLVQLWSINGQAKHVPPHHLILETLSLVDYQNLTLDKHNSAKLTLPGMAVDLGAIAKGFAADQAAQLLRMNGVQHSLINLGGNILTIGSHPDGSPWRIGIQDPFSERGDYLGIVDLDDTSLVTSGIYERYFESEGKSYHHILNPETGYPVENQLALVAVVAASSTHADALSTVLFLLGLEQGLELAETLGDVEGIFVTKEKEIYLTSGADNIFQLVKHDFIKYPTNK